MNVNGILSVLLISFGCAHLAEAAPTSPSAAREIVRARLGDFMPPEVPRDAPVLRGHFTYNSDGPSFVECGRPEVRMWAVGQPLFRVVSPAERWKSGMHRVAYVEVRGLVGEIRDAMAYALDVDGVQYSRQLDVGELIVSREPSAGDCR